MGALEKFGIIINNNLINRHSVASMVLEGWKRISDYRPPAALPGASATLATLATAICNTCGLNKVLKIRLFIVSCDSDDFISSSRIFPPSSELKGAKVPQPAPFLSFVCLLNTYMSCTPCQ